MLGQFALHIATLIYISNWVQQKEPKDESFDPDAGTEFEPSLLNSAIYLLQLVQQISTFACNYQGRPFRESIRENRGMYWGIVLVSGVALSCATEFIPEINERMRLVKFEADFQVRMLSVMVIDFVGCWIIERGLKALFSDFRAKPIAARRPDQLKIEEGRRKVREAEEAEEREKEQKKQKEERDKKIEKAKADRDRKIAEWKAKRG